MAIPVLLILAVLWAAVLVPPVLRSRSESRRGSVSDFTRLGALMDPHSSPRSGARGARAPLQSVPAPRARSGRARGVGGRPSSRPGRERRAGAARPATTTAPAQKRRRDVVIVLVAGVILTLGLAVLVDPVVWIAQVAADVLLATYLYLLVLFKRHGGLAPSADDFWSGPASRSRPVTLAHPRVPARPELAPMPGAARPRRSAAG
ncbi:MAG TPA: hypothetical protein VKB11_01045 [Acidimicrobiia bacterium]|nr:hypothetical protein [Acidimicrobiia bacterium]